MTCEVCSANCQRFGKHRNGLRRFRCPNCKKTYTESHQRTLGQMYVSQEKVTLALQLLLEGNSIRSTERITGLDRNTIMRALILAGERCQGLLDAKLQNLNCKRLQMDELWCFVGKKQRHVKKDDPDEFGSNWIFVAMCPDTKLVVSHSIGKRSLGHTQEFTWNTYQRMSGKERIQVTTDGLNHYRHAVVEAFGSEVDFAQLIKIFGDHGQHDSDARYSPSPISEVISKVRRGNPDPKHISTSYIERQNLTLRMQVRRLTRLTNAFSKKLSHLKAAVALHFAYYNFCRVHSSLRVTPAMESNLTDHVWELKELLS
jgi:transposase-like protein/IS1 family transposase